MPKKTLCFDRSKKKKKKTTCINKKKGQRIWGQDNMCGAVESEKVNINC